MSEHDALADRTDAERRRGDAIRERQGQRACRKFTRATRRRRRREQHAAIVDRARTTEPDEQHAARARAGQPEQRGLPRTAREVTAREQRLHRAAAQPIETRGRTRVRERALGHTHREQTRGTGSRFGTADQDVHGAGPPGAWGIRITTVRQDIAPSHSSRTRRDTDVRRYDTRFMSAQHVSRAHEHPPSLTNNAHEARSERVISLYLPRVSPTLS